MARQNRNPETEAVETEAVEGTETEPQGDSKVETTETPEVPVDLTAFTEAVEAAVAQADPATGEIPAEAFGPVNEQYRALDGVKAKTAARNSLDAAMLDAVSQLDAVKARSYSDTKGQLSAGSSGGTTRTPADPTAAYVQRVASLRLALGIIESQRPEGEGLDEKVESLVNESQELVSAHLAHEANEDEDKGDGPELTPVVRAAVKAASGRATGGGTRKSSGGPRGSIAKHITEVFAEHESGHFLTVNEIAKAQTSEYAANTASQGAVSARLFPTNGKASTVEGVVPVEKGEIDGKNPKGARKA